MFNRFNDSLSWRVGRGNRILFWEDCWIGGRSLREEYPKIYVNSMQKDLRLEEVGKWTGLGWEWKKGWRREWFEWQKPSVEAFFTIIQQYKPKGRDEDQWVWKGKKSI